MTAMSNREAADILRSHLRDRLGRGFYSDTDASLEVAIEALDPWQAPRASIPWVAVEDHPHPTDGNQFMARDLVGEVWLPESRKADSQITHWCLLPEETP